MPIPLVIWGVSAAVAAVAGLGYAGYKAFDDGREQSAVAEREREAASQEREAQQRKVRAESRRRQLNGTAIQMCHELSSLGISLARQPRHAEMLAWAQGRDRQPEPALAQRAEREARVLDVSIAEADAFQHLLEVLGEAVVSHENDSLPERLARLEHLQDQRHQLKVLERHIKGQLGV